MPPTGICKIHKDVVAYGRRLVRDGWTEIAPDEVRNPRYTWPGSPAVLTLRRAGSGRWRQEADEQVARMTGRRNTARTVTPKRLAPVADPDSLAAAAARIAAANARNNDEQRRRRLMAAEDNLHAIQALMRAPR